ncbi:unnamed protein product [Didymodactylos carnosus]|uniref:Uncharacterized protein n=1 Tax=Didymodactylos carnosus TaxID=1234261 RepID=A0A816BFT8_9BILA|nr:unnamed protein product [Didymodactylos carnosus]CAF4490193.1 unnamed protein product [Didymodactylos carnosus]
MDGTLVAFDSIQGGGSGIVSNATYGDTVGKWECQNNKVATARAIVYIYPTGASANGSIAMNTYRINFRSNNKCDGTFNYNFWRLGTNPLNKKNKPIEKESRNRFVGYLIF